MKDDAQLDLFRDCGLEGGSSTPLEIPPMQPGSPAYRIRRSRRAKRLSIRVTADGVEVVLPWKMAERYAHEFADQNREWMLRKLEDVGKTRPAKAKSWPGLPELLSCGAGVPFDGSVSHLRVVIEETDSVRIEAGNGFKAHASANSTSEEIREALASFLDGWLVRCFETHAPSFSALLGVSPSGVRLRDMKTLWGSCSQSGKITLNRQLARMPARVVEYTIAHELCHLRIRGHGKAFWALLARLMPDYEEHRSFLRRSR